MEKQNFINIKSEKFKNAILCVTPLVFTILFHLLKITDEANVRFFMQLSLAFVTAYGGYLAYRGKLDAAKAVTLILIAGVIIRTGYTIYTDAFTRAHDMDGNMPDGVGHFSYVYQVFNGHLPTTNTWQFYHPPLFHIISAAFIRVSMLITGSDNFNDYTYMAQTVSCIASCAALITFSKIMDELNIKKHIQIIPVVLTAFYPAQILAAAYMNNDALVFMFMLLAIYFTLKWHKEQKMAYIIGIAVTIGCGMMTKISCALVAFIAGPVMIYHFIKRIKSKDSSEIKNIIIQLAVFAVIVFPLGMWYAIRNYILFDQPLNFVLDVGSGFPVWTGDKPFITRWVNISLAKLFTQPYGEDVNVWADLIKTGVHGMYEWEGESGVLAWGLDYIHAALMAVTLAAVAFTAAKNTAEYRYQRYSVLAVWAIVGISYISFNVSHPAITTSDFRYVFLGQVAAAVLVGYFTNYCFKNRDKRLYNILCGINITVIMLFCVMSIIKFA